MAIELVVLLDSWKGSLKACEWEIDLAMLSDSETAKVSVHSIELAALSEVSSEFAKAKKLAGRSEIHYRACMLR